MTIIDKIVIFCNDVNKQARSNMGLGIKSTTGPKTFVEEWKGHNTVLHPLKFDELLNKVIFFVSVMN